ncbi:Phosphoesterase RecJ-like protein [Macrophomina phaseolina MS6]|uniref:Phosphoesterase RecJ-like protein n=1 Tax=Macrophomina phaseolina (strain MS6) TaxID=1126212 RepID=K2SF77_MACPH|nr:Phosphoesterase RecJ-like protein [Macrophomina phaseolina MS6]
MKRAAPSSGKVASKAKKARPKIPEYHLTPSLKDDSGEIIWPAPKDQMERARNFIQRCASAGKKTLIVPDKDADGLSSGVILQKTLVLLGLRPELISAHLLQKGNSIHTDSERQAMAAHEPEYVFVLDQGSRKSPPVIDRPHKALIVDHHYAEEDDFPEGSEHVTACNSPPVATSSLLTYHLCRTQGDLGTTLKWEPPFPDMRHVFKAYTKKSLTDAVAMINAPRRTASFNVPAAWKAVTAAEGPVDLVNHKELNAARTEVQAEVERSKLEVVLVANEGVRDPPVNIIAVLKEVADRAPDQTLRERLGQSFARGHKEASGGIVPVDEFEELMACMEVGKKPEGTSPRKKKDAAPQSNTLMNYFGKGSTTKINADQ